MNWLGVATRGQALDRVQGRLMMITRQIVERGVLVLLFVAGSALPSVAQGVGAIGGTVMDETEAVLPGVTVTLSSAQGTIGGNQETVSDARGAYQFLRLVPGTYSVRAQLQGFRPVEQPNIVVTSDSTARADIQLRVGEIEEALIVTAAAPLLDTTNALRMATLSRQEMETLPNRTDVWSMARVIPGIVTGQIDVGGTSGYQGNTAAVRGSSSDNKWMVDGMDDSSMSGNGTIANFYLDPYMFEQTSFVLGAGSAENSAGGLTFNMITRTGTNVWHGGAKFNGTTPALANNQSYSPDLTAQLLANVPAKVKAANPNFVPNQDIQRMTDVGSWIGGPIIRDKLWFVAAWHDQNLDNHQLNSYDPNNAPVVVPNTMWNVGGKVSWQVTKDAQLSYFNDIQKKLIAVRGGPAFASTAAHQYNIKYPTVHQVKFVAPIRSKFAFDLNYNRFRADDTFLPEPGVSRGDVATFDTTTQVGGVALAAYSDNDMYRDQIKTSLSWSRGSHFIKSGYEFVRGARKSRLWSVSGMAANFANGVPVSVNTLLVPVTTVDEGLQIPSDIPVLYSYRENINGAYVQDKWTPWRKLVLNLGLRYETSASWMDPTCRPATAFAPAACYDKITPPSFASFSPRFNVVYDLNGDGKTALKFAASRYNQPVGVSLLDRLNPLVVSSNLPGGSVAAVADTRQWLPQSRCNDPGVVGCDRNGDLIPQLNELGPSPGYVIPSPNSGYATDLKRPVADEYTIEFQREMAGIVFSVDYAVRHTRRNIGQMNTAAPPSTWTGPITVTEVVSGQTVQVWNRGTSAATNFFYNSTDLETNYRGADVMLSKRLSNHWSLLGGATFGKVTAATRGGDRNNPNLTNPPAFDTNVTTADDRPWSYRASGVYELRYDLMVSATWQYQAGAPETTTVLVTAQTRTLAQGNQAVQVAPTGSTRLPNSGTVDLNVRKAFQLRGHARISPRLEIFNATNRSTITTWLTQLGPTYHYPSLLQRSRLIKLELGIDF